MRIADILGIAFSALFQQKVRTILTMSGVVIGSFTLAVSLSLGRGFEDEIQRQLGGGRQLRQIMVWRGSGVKESDIPKEVLEVKGDMSEAKRRRLRKAIISRWRPRSRGVQLTRARVKALARLPHVKAVDPVIKQRGEAFLGRHHQNVDIFAASSDGEQFRSRILAGEYLPSDDGRFAVVGEYLLYQWGYASDAEVQSVLGKKMRLVFHPRAGTPALQFLGDRLDLKPRQRAALEKALRDLPSQLSLSGLTEEEQKLVGEVVRYFTRQPAFAPPQVPGFSREFTITGVLREYVPDEDTNTLFDFDLGAGTVNYDVLIPPRTAAELFGPSSPQAADLSPEEFAAGAGAGAATTLPTTEGYPAVVVTVDREENIQEVSTRIKEMGLQEYSLQELVKNVRTSLILITFLTAFLAAVALLVAALGICNTMIMSILERTREIGVMKAVGARDSHIQLIFLVEGALIGVIGGALGVFLCWLASFPGDTLARWLLQDKAQQTLKGSLFVFPFWLILGAPAFAGLVTTLAAVYPARRAAKVNPITALRSQ